MSNKNELKNPTIWIAILSSIIEIVFKFINLFSTSDDKKTDKPE